jgi:hypothetical protein
MTRRLIVLTAVMVMPLSAQSYSDAYDFVRPGMGTPRALRSDPAVSSYSPSIIHDVTQQSYTMHMGREARRSYEKRIWEEQNRNRNPPALKLNMAPWQTPMPSLPPVHSPAAIN